MSPMSKGPQGPRRSPQQTRAAQKERDIMQQMRDDEMARRMQESYERAQRQSMSGMKKGGKVKKYAAGGSASKRADGCAVKGKTRGKFV
jgi:hypothetical protein